ncbi:MAG: UDP-3-O-(3-hydroxymyristoyl)glucosamine N-acyltransferase [Proteobacteria bacterium]|nr:MAG: UDP-3-O-(3-hydroxymyristoyl)glucosamine N-acyltransferase [Pseudomonadota bacterium]
MKQGWTLADLSEATASSVQGNPERRIVNIAPIEQAQQDDISYIRDRQYARFLDQSEAGALILTPDLAEQYQGDALINSNPYLTYARIVSLLYPPQWPKPGIHPSAVVAKTLTLGKGVHIGAHAVVEEGVTLADGVVIGAHCFIGRDSFIATKTVLYPHVSVGSATWIGQRAIIHSGAVLGADGFGFVPDQGAWYKIPQVGRVVLGDDVEIGANTTIDRAAMGETRLGNGVKLDNLIHIAHNVKIGDHTAIAACTGIAGSAQIGSHCQISGMCSIAGHLSIADRVTITATSFVINSITQPGVYSSGTTVEKHSLWRKNAVRFRQLDQLSRRVNALEKQLAELQKKDS